MLLIPAVDFMVSEIFFSIMCLWEQMTPGLRHIWTPGAWLAGFSSGTTIYALLHTKYISCGLHVYREDSFMFFAL